MFQQERERASATKRSHAAGPTRLAYSCWTVPAGTFCRVLAEKNGAGRRGFLRHPISADNGRLSHGDAGREWGARRPRALMLPILRSTNISFLTQNRLPAKHPKRGRPLQSIDTDVFYRVWRSRSYI